MPAFLEIGVKNMIWIALIVLAVAAAAYWRMRPKSATNNRSATNDRSATTKPRAASPFGSVEIQTRGVPCEAANALSGQRFLVKDAPQLPLPVCDAQRCHCRFVKLSDRRTEDRRLENTGIHASLFLANDRREHAGRRGED